MNRLLEDKGFEESLEAIAIRHPYQPIVIVDGVARFKANSIINYLFNSGKLDLNHLELIHFEREDRIQIAQLLGYSLSGFQELPYVTDEDIDRIPTKSNVK